MSDIVARNTRAPDIEVAPLEDGAILFDERTKKFFMLNSSAAVLWNELEAPASSDELAARLQAQFPDLAEDDALRDVEAALATLAEAGLLARS